MIHHSAFNVKKYKEICIYKFTCTKLTHRLSKFGTTDFDGAVFCVTKCIYKTKLSKLSTRRPLLLNP